MKKLIKSGVCGTREQCIYALFTKDRSTVAAEKKKKKKNADIALKRAIQTYTKSSHTLYLPKPSFSIHIGFKANIFIIKSHR